MDRLLRISEVIPIVGISKSVIYQRLKDSDFPKPVNVGPRAVRWRQSDIETWIGSLEAAHGPN